MMMSKYWLIDPWRKTTECQVQLWRSCALYLLPQEAPVMNCCQVSVMDLDQLVQVLCLLYLVLKLQSCAVQNLARDDADTWEIVCTFLYLYVVMVKFVTFQLSIHAPPMWLFSKQYLILPAEWLLLKMVRCEVHSIWMW